MERLEKNGKEEEREKGNWELKERVRKVEKMWERKERKERKRNVVIKGYKTGGGEK